MVLDLNRCMAGGAPSGGILGTGWRRHLAAIGAEAGFREPIVRAVCAAVAEAGGVPEDLNGLAAEIAAAVRAADPGGRDRHTIERYASAAHTREIALWAARQAQASARQSSNSRSDATLPGPRQAGASSGSRRHDASLLTGRELPASRPGCRHGPPSRSPDPDALTAGGASASAPRARPGGRSRPASAVSSSRRRAASSARSSARTRSYGRRSPTSGPGSRPRPSSTTVPSAGSTTRSRPRSAARAAPRSPSPCLPPSSRALGWVDTQLGALAVIAAGATNRLVTTAIKERSIAAGSGAEARGLRASRLAQAGRALGLSHRQRSARQRGRGRGHRGAAARSPGALWARRSAMPGRRCRRA